MRLESLSARRVRNLTDVQIAPSAEVNIIYGENAAGKTAILESIYLLSKARSFRTSRIQEVIQHEKADLAVSGTVTNEKNKRIQTGIRKSDKETEIKHDGERVRTVSAQAKNVVVQTAISDNTKILTGSPKDRRKWIDWALFHVEHDYLQVWHSYHHALRNRNALLRRSARDEEFFVWEETMAVTTKALGDMWSNYLVRLQQYYHETVREHPRGKIVFSVKKAKTDGFLEHLQSTRQSDMRAGFTQQGPHKVDFEFKAQNKNVNTIFSRGQIKLFVTVLSIAQAKLLKNERGIDPIILVDDLTAELDKKTVTMVLEWLYDERVQLFITTTEPDNILKNNKEITMFHVKHGEVKRC